MKRRLITALLASTAFGSVAHAHCVHGKYYLGGGIGLNSSANYSETNGYQFLGGLCTDFNFKSNKSKTSIELGYMSSGTFSRDYTVRPNNPNRSPYTATESASYQGMWVSGVAEYKFRPELHLLARIGYDVGDDNGAFIGAGIGFNITRWAQIRAEMINKPEVDSMQVNWISEF